MAIRIEGTAFTLARVAGETLALRRFGRRLRRGDCGAGHEPGSSSPLDPLDAR